MSNLLRKGIRFYHQQVVKLQLKQNPDYHLILAEPAAESLENVNSVSKLNFLKSLDLAKQGYLNPDRKALFSEEKKFLTLLNLDQQVRPVGRISVGDPEHSQQHILVGYHNKTGKILLATSHIKEVPVWKKPNLKEIQQQVRNVQPLRKDGERPAVGFDHLLYKDDLEGLRPEVQQNLETNFQKIANGVFLSNKYIDTSFKVLPDDLPNLKHRYMNQPFKVPSSFFGKNSGEKTMVATLVDKNENDYVFKPMFGNSNELPVSVSRETIENYINGRKIDMVAKINPNVVIGKSKTDGTVNIGIKIDKGGFHWKSYKELKHSVRFNAREKELMTKIIENKDYLLEKDKIVLQNPKNPDQRIIVQYHGNKKGLFFMEAYGNKKVVMENFKKLDGPEAKIILKKYSDATNISSFKKLAQSENILEKRSGISLSDLPKASAHAIHR